MSKTDNYRDILQSLNHWEPYLLKESGLPGPRGNIELARAVAVEGGADLFYEYLQNTPEIAPTNDSKEFLMFCGVLGLGQLLKEGDVRIIQRLRDLANDPRWRVREAVAMALQSFGETNFQTLLIEMLIWAEGSLLEQRAAAAAVCEPALLKQPGEPGKVFDLLDRITANLQNKSLQKTPEFKALRKGLAYCWSVAVAAFPQPGKVRMARWIVDENIDIRWVMKQNLKKKRLERSDPHWTAHWLEMLS